MVRVYNRPLLRSSARGDGALKARNDRFAIGLRNPDASIRATLRIPDFVRHDMSLVRKLHPALFATWLFAHALLALWGFAEWAIVHVSETADPALTVAQVYGKVRTLNDAIARLPENVWMGLGLVWLAGFAAIAVPSAVLQYVARRTSTTREFEISRDVLKWAPSSRIALTIILLTVITTYVVATTNWSWLVLPLLIATFTLGTHEPLLQPVGGHVNWSLLRSRVPSLVVAICAFIALLFVERMASWALALLYSPLEIFGNLVLYLIGMVVSTYLLSGAIYGFADRNAFESLRRYATWRWIAIWLYFDYRLYVVAAWLLPTLLLTAVFGWFAIPTIHQHAQEARQPMPLFAEAIAIVVDTFTRYWYLFCIPIVGGLWLAACGRVLVVLEQRDVKAVARE